MPEDPRVLRAIKSLSEPRRVYLVTSSKGGVGKTTTSVLLSLYSSYLGFRVGLLDLDFVNPSTHIVLGVKPSDLKYKEERGVAPYKLRDMLYFSIVAYTGDNPIALRGKAAKNALWETLSIINWGELDALFIDTPPGIGDEHLEIIYKLRGIITPIIVSNPTSLSLKSTYRLIQILMNANYKKLALLENMGQGTLETLARDLHLIYIGYIPYSSAIEECTGDPTSLLKLDIGSHVELVLKRLLI